MFAAELPGAEGHSSRQGNDELGELHRSRGDAAEVLLSAFSLRVSRNILRTQEALRAFHEKPKLVPAHATQSSGLHLAASSASGVAARMRPCIATRNTNIRGDRSRVQKTRRCSVPAEVPSGANQKCVLSLPTIRIAPEYLLPT